MELSTEAHGATLSKMWLLASFRSGVLAAEGWLGPESRAGFSSQNELLTKLESMRERADGVQVLIALQRKKLEPIQPSLLPKVSFADEVEFEKLTQAAHPKIKQSCTPPNGKRLMGDLLLIDNVLIKLSRLCF